MIDFLAGHVLKSTHVNPTSKDSLTDLKLVSFDSINLVWYRYGALGMELILTSFEVEWTRKSYIVSLLNLKLAPHFWKYPISVRLHGTGWGRVVTNSEYTYQIN